MSDVDFRTLIEYDEPRPRTQAGYCTICAQHGDWTEHTDLTVTKHHWANRPLGQLISRCPEHQTYWEKKQHEADVGGRGSGR